MNLMKKSLYAAFLVSCFCSPVFAQNSYIFAGYSHVNLTSKDDGYSIPVDLSGNGYQLGIGYAFSKPFAIELGYSELLNKKSHVNWFGSDVNASVKVSAVHVSLVGRYELVPDVALYGRVGVGQLTSNERYTSQTPGDTGLYAGTDNKKGSKLMAAAGLSYRLSSNWRMRLEYLRFANFYGLNISSTSAGIEYTF